MRHLVTEFASAPDGNRKRGVMATPIKARQTRGGRALWAAGRVANPWMDLGESLRRFVTLQGRASVMASGAMPGLLTPAFRRRLPWASRNRSGRRRSGSANCLGKCGKYELPWRQVAGQAQKFVL